MYTYKLVNNDEFKTAYKEYYRKNLLKGSLIITGFITLILFLLLFLFLIIIYKANLIILICIYSIALILEAIIFSKSYKNAIRRILDSVSNTEINISFDEKGIYISQDGILRNISWKAVREVIVDENNLLFHFNVTGVPGNFFYLKFFDVQKEDLLIDIKKYVMVKGC
ncbi:hypothetical protein [Clostridium sp.]|uniref:hypothetical protein n=1 Tax=Clostridium sp. TaxID=1506 RepID=UPI001DDB2B3D|nr:hypothetical protein [Clostridium sp.]MBS5937867.1 hypothetical protein [Clostridium sp.]